MASQMFHPGFALMALDHVNGLVSVCFGMQATGEIVGVSEVIESDLSHARHHAHIEHDIDAVGNLDTDFAER